MRKKLLSTILAFTFCCLLFLSGCDNGATATVSHSLGEAVQTDIVKFTLSNAELAIKLNTTSYGTLEDMKSGNTEISDDFFTADEYNADEDLGKAYVASVGHTYVAIEFCVENLDRGSLDLDDYYFGSPLFDTVIYNGESYSDVTQYGAISSNGYAWERYDSSNILLQPGETSYYRCFIDIPVEANSFDDEFDLIVTLPNSGESSEKFTYHVTPSDKASTEESEMKLDEAIYNFKQPEGREYFKNNINNYALMSSEDILAALTDNTFTIINIIKAGSVNAEYTFESSYNIFETALSLSDKPSGYLNNLTWSVSDNNLVISGSSDDDYEMHKVGDGIYVGYTDGEPKLLLTK